MLALQHRSLEQRRAVDNGGHRFVTVHIGTIHLGYLSPRQTSAVNELLPADALCPPFEHADIQAVIAYIMESMLNILPGQVLPCALASIAALDAIDGQHDDSLFTRRFATAR